MVMTKSSNVETKIIEKTVIFTIFFNCETFEISNYLICKLFNVIIYHSWSYF